MQRISLVLTLALFSSVARATTVLDIPLEGLSTRASIVCRGTVVDSTASWYGGRSAIVTRTRLHVTEVLKGNALIAAGQDLIVMETGGVVDGVGQAIPGAAHFDAKEDVVLFLEPAAHDAATWILPTMSASKFHATQSGNQVDLTRDVTDLMFVHKNPAGRLVPLSSPPQATITLEALRTLVRKASAP